MDADERLRPEEHGRLRRLIERSASEDAFLVPIRSETPTGAQVTRAHRLFRNHKGIRFSGRIHEQVSPSFAQSRAREGASAADFTIDHLGYNFSAEKLRSKHERNRKLLNAAKEQNPRDAYVRFCLGQALMLLGDAAGAEKEIRAALGETPSDLVSKRLPDDIRAAALNNLAQCALGRSAPEEALQRCAGSLRICPNQVTAHLMAYRAHQALRHPEQALQALVTADRLLDQPSAGRSAIEVTVNRAELWSAMGWEQLQLGQFAHARQSLQRALAAREGRCERTLAGLARCAIAENALDEALRLANEASALAPEDDGLADLTCFILLKLGRFDDAAERMRGLLERRPADPVLRRRLVGVLAKAGRPQEALAAARAAGGLSPDPRIPPR
jgi:tetratricopeptide (TPR) repeat protein